MVILHGLFGSLANWRTVGRSLARRHRVYLVDQRNHGRSPHAPSHTYDDLVVDMVEFLDRREVPKAALVGHSMGGKTAMKLALAHPDRVESLVVVDIGPRRHSAEGLRPVLDALIAVEPSQWTTRDEVAARLAERIPSPRLREFLLMNLARDESGAFRWRLNLGTLDRCFEALGEPITSETVFGGPALFLRGALSDHLSDADWSDARRLFPRARLVTIPGAGHWVHADAPAAFQGALAEFLSRPAGSD